VTRNTLVQSAAQIVSLCEAVRFANPYSPNSFVTERKINPAWWRRWHRWIALPASVFLLWAAGTGAIVAFTEFFGPEEALREATRDLVSPVTASSPAELWSAPVSRAVAAVNAASSGAPIDKIQIQFKGDKPTVTVFTGKPTGGEDKKYVVDAKSGDVLSVEAYADKALIYRLHSGEAFGDGGLVMAMTWSSALAFLTISGFIVYLTMRRKNATGIQKVFW
jgi:uncharacterized iron-regulated membrane protein